jgi:hypothetical protein
MAVVQHGSEAAIGKVVDIYDGTGGYHLQIPSCVDNAFGGDAGLLLKRCWCCARHASRRTCCPQPSGPSARCVVRRHARHPAHPAGGGGPRGRAHGAGAVPQVHRAARGRCGAAPDDRPAAGPVRHRCARQAETQEPAQQAAQAVNCFSAAKLFVDIRLAHDTVHNLQCRPSMPRAGSLYRPINPTNKHMPHTGRSIVKHN